MRDKTPENRLFSSFHTFYLTKSLNFPIFLYLRDQDDCFRRSFMFRRSLEMIGGAALRPEIGAHVILRSARECS